MNSLTSLQNNFKPLLFFSSKKTFLKYLKSKNKSIGKLFLFLWKTKNNINVLFSKKKIEIKLETS